MTDVQEPSHVPSRPSPRVAIYARYSSDRQNDRSTEDQMQLCRWFAESRNWTVVSCFEDKAMSGTIFGRPGYQALLQAAETGAFDIVLSEDLDRLTRSQSEAPRLFEQLDYLGIELWSANNGRLNEMHIGFQGTMNALYLKNLSSKTRRGLNAVVERGGHPGGRVFGYRSAPKERLRTDRGHTAEGGTLEIDPDEAAVVVRIFELYGVAGKLAEQIAGILNDEEVHTPRSGTWRSNTILGDRKKGTGLLNNALYVGIRVYGKQRWKKAPGGGNRRATSQPSEIWKHYPVPELAIVPQALWDAVKARQAALDARMADQARANGSDNKRKGIGANRRNQYLLTQVLKCGVCGSNMTGGNGRYLRCSTAKESGGSKCNHRTLCSRAEIERQILEMLQRELMRPEAVEDFVAAYNAKIAERNASRTAALGRKRRKLAEVAQQIENLVEVIATGKAPASVLAKIEALEADKAALGAELAAPAPSEISFHPKAVEAYRRAVGRLAKLLEDEAQRGAAIDGIRGLLERVVLHPRPDRGAKECDLEVEGGLAALLGAAGVSAPEAAEIDAVSRESGQLVAGAGFEPATFRL